MVSGQLNAGQMVVRNTPDLEEELKGLLKKRQIDIQDLLKRVC